MYDLSHIDPNFKAPEIDLEGIVFHDVRKADVDFYGLYRPREEKVFCRMPMEKALEVNEWTALLSQYTAGGQLRFKTDSPRLVFRVHQDVTKKPSPNGTAIMVAGFDVYVYENGMQSFRSCVSPPLDKGEYWQAAATLPKDKLNDVVVNFPLYNGVIDLEIGIVEGSTLQPGSKYLPLKPVVYYGSSITQGGCASRPGNAYTAMLSRRLNVEHLNLGFSGRAKGEPVMAEYIASIPASVYVVDYDFNAPNPEHLENTHEPFVRILREKNPDTPILMISRATIPLSEVAVKGFARRRAAILKTYESLVKDGDRNIRFIDGQTIYCSDDCTVDTIHPNDLGMACMADAIEPDLRELLFGDV